MKNPLRNAFKSRTYRHYEQRGYQIFRRAFAASEIGAFADRIRQLVPAYDGLIWRHSGNMEFNEFYSPPLVKNALLNAHITIAAGLEPISAMLRQLVTSRALGDRLQALDGEEHYTIHQTILFLSAPATDLHLDSWSLDTAPHGGAHTVWIPLQDMNPTSGVQSVIPWPKDRLVTEAELGLLPEDPGRYERYHQALSARLLADAPEAITPLMRAGDFIVWSSLTPHFTLPSRPYPIERLALQLLVCPTRRIWGNYLNQPPKWTIDRSVRVTDQFSILFT